MILAQYTSPLVTIAPTSFSAAYSTPLDNATPVSEAELGFIEIVVDARGTPFRGAAFSDPAPDHLAKMGLDDDVAVIRQLASRDASMDLSRVGIVGASFGAWTTIRALIGYNDLFKAGVAWAPPGAFHSMYPAAELTAPSGPPVYADGSSRRPRPGDTPANWEMTNSIAQIDRLKGRLLLGEGALDENVLPGSTMQFLDAAAKAGKDVETIFLPGATHGPMPYWPYVVKRTWDFLVRNLRGGNAADRFCLAARYFPARALTGARRGCARDFLRHQRQRDRSVRQHGRVEVAQIEARAERGLHRRALLDQEGITKLVSTTRRQDRNVSMLSRPNRSCALR